MIKKFFILILLGFINVLFAQKEVLDKYPPGQDFYAGGISELNKEMIKIVKEQNILPCEKSQEAYLVKILVNEDSTLDYVKDFDTIEIEKNKCAFSFGRKIIPFLKGWVPAKYKDNNIAAIATIMINPFFLYHSKTDPDENKKSAAVYKKGFTAFENEVRDVFEKNIRENEDKTGFLTFFVNEEGGMEDFVLTGKFSESDKKEILKGLSRIKGKWIPAMFNDSPLKSKISIPLAQNFDMEQQTGEIGGFSNQKTYNRYYKPITADPRYNNRHSK